LLLYVVSLDGNKYYYVLQHNGMARIKKTILTARIKVFQTVWCSENTANYLEFAGEVKTV